MRKLLSIISLILAVMMLTSSFVMTLAEYEDGVALEPGAEIAEEAGLTEDAEDAEDAEETEDEEEEPVTAVFTDIAGHWAEVTLRKAYDDGLIGSDDNRLYPDSNITTAHALVILCRILDAEMKADTSGTGLSDSVWYYEFAAKAMYLGLIPSGGAVNYNVPLSRQNAFALLAEAFQISQAKPDMSVLNRYSDSALIINANRRAIASLVSQGLVGGSGGRLNVNGNTTRAEFLTLAYRVFNEFTEPPEIDRDYATGVIIRGSAELEKNKFDRGVWFDCSATDIQLTGVDADSLTIRSHSLENLDVGASVSIKRLILAAQSGDIDISAANRTTVGTLVIGTGSGDISVSGIDTIEITGSNRNVIISGNVKNIMVTGRDNIISIDKGGQADKIELLRGANNNRFIIEGIVNEFETLGLSTKIEGGGSIKELTLALAYTEVDIKYEKMHDVVDHGLIEASINIDIPERLPVATTLNAAAILEDVAPGKKCDIIWYLNGNVFSQGSFTTGDRLPGLSHRFTYSRNMRTDAVVKVVIRYTTEDQGERQEISAERTIKLDNYNKQHWIKQASPRVLREVKSEYKGNFTLAWARANDYDAFDKEVWVNAKGYSSKSDYLVWVNLTYQRVNVFEGSKGNWELKKTFIVGTGATRSPTRRGVTTVSYKQRGGWTTSSYTVRPVVRFYPGTGFAFHSRLYHPRTDRLRDASIGYPISRGCVRMYDEDIWYLFNNVPEGSTVVVF